MPRNVDGEIIVGIDIPASTKIVESDIRKLLQNLTTLEAKINHADLTDNAKQELRKQINDIKNLTANVEHLALDDTAKQEFRNVVGKVNNLTANIQNVKLDPSFQVNLQTELNKLSGLAINISGVNINQNAVQGAGQKIGQQIGQQVQQGITQAIQKTKDVEFVFGVDGKKPRNQAAQRAKEYYQQHSNGTVTVREEMENDGGKSKLKSFIVDIKNAEGAVESLRYSIEAIKNDKGIKTGEQFVYKGGSINDKGVIKQINAIETAIASYEQKVAQFKSTNEGILSGINFTNFDNALTALKNGTGSIDSVKIAYKDLGVQASNITKELSGQLSKAGTAVRNLAKGKETISGLKAEFKGLNDTPKDILTQLTGLEKKLNNINALEQKNGRNADWAKAYREWQDEIDVLTAKLRVLQKEQSNASSSQVLSMSDLTKGGRAYISKVSNTVNKNSSEVQKMANANGWTDWDITGIERADGMVKKLTVTFTDAEGAIKRFVMQRDKIVSQKGNEYNALVQVGDVQVIKSATTAEKELANAIGSRREQAEQSRKSEEKRLNVAQSKAQNKAIEEEYKNQEKLTDAIAKGREKSELARKEEEKRLELAQSKASNKAIENEIKDRNKLADAMAKGREQSELSRKAEEKRVSDSQNKAINKNIEQEAREQQRVADAIDKQVQKTQEAKKEEERRLNLAQNKAINKNLEQEAKERQKLIDLIEKEREKTQEARKAEEKKLSDAQNKAINKNIEQQAKDSAKKRAQAEESVNAELKIQRRTLSEIIILENQINNIDGNKEPEKLAYLKQQKKIKDDEYKISRQTMKSVAEEVMTEEELLALEQRRRKEMQEVASLARQAVSASNEQVTNKQAEKQTKKIKSIDDNVANNTYATQINDLITKYKQYGLTVDQAEDKVRELRTALATMSNADKSAEERIKAEERYQQALKKSQNEARVYAQNQRGLATDQQRLALANTMEAFLQKNTRITAKARQETEMYIATLRNLNSEMTVVAKNEINNSFKQMQNNMRVLGKLGYALKDQMKRATGSFVQWFSVSNLIMTGIYHIRQIPIAVKEVNSAMIELNKVSSASSQEIANYFKDASYHAKDLGASISDVISATADWSRLGYNLPDSEELARVALVYKNVGDGIDIDTATESLTSTLQGFQLEASEAMGVVDKFNEVANRTPIDSAGIGEALRRSAASFHAANTDLSKSIALIVGSNAVIQDPDSVGTMWKTVSMRIRGATAELEEAGLETEGMVSTTSQLRDLVKGMTGFDIMEDENTFKDIYEIMLGIGEEWNNLTDIQQASLLEKLAGKRQGNALAAALSNINLVKEAYQIAEESAGSAMREQEEYEKGIQYSLDRLTAAFQEFSNTILEADAFKFIVDSGTSALEVITKLIDALGSFGSIGMIGSAIAGAKGLG